MLENRPLLLVDEFKSGLDEESSKLITDKLFDSENTIIMISHNLDKSFDSIIFMEKGKIIAKYKYELLLETCDNFNDFLMYTATDGGNHHEYNITSLSFE